MTTLSIPFVGSVIETDAANTFSSAIRGQQFRNVIFRLSANRISGGRRIEARPMRAFSSTGAPSGSGRGTAVMVWTGKGTGDTTVSAFGTTNSTIYSASSSLGAITGYVVFFSETTISGTANVVALASNGRAWFYPDGGSLTEITDAQYPGQASLVPTGNFVHMDGYAFIACTNGQIWNSDLNSVSAWTAGNYVTASDKPDGLLGIAKAGDYLWAFGPLSCQPYYNAGNAAGSPLSPVRGATISIGALNQYCILPFRDTIAWVGLSAENNPGVYLLEGRSPKKISTPLIDEWLSGASYLKLHQWMDRGRHLLFVATHADVTTASGTGFLYDMDLDQWSVAKLASIVVNQTAIKREAAGNVYLVAVDDATNAVKDNDDDSYETANVVVGPIGNGSPHNIKNVRILGDGFGSSTAGTATIYASHTDRANGWDSGRSVSMRNPIAWRLGHSRTGQSRLQIEWSGAASPDDFWINELKVELM